jgi:effector-binding domain-containing protein
MKLTNKQAKTLIAVLNAQSKVTPIDDKEKYNSMKAEVASFLQVKDGKAVGGITAEVYKDNKDNAELVEAAKVHLETAKARAEKAKAKAAPKKEKTASKETKTSKVPTEKEEAGRAKAIVAFINAVTNVKKLPQEEYSKAYNKAKKYLDFKKGGLVNEAAEGKKTPYERFKAFPGVLEAAKAHKAYVKNKAKGKEAIEL